MTRAHLVLFAGIMGMVWVGAGVSSAQDAPAAWRTFYEDGKWEGDVTAWTGAGTRSELTDEGLLVADESSKGGSGRSYLLNWHADTERGAAIEARVKVVSCSQAWGVSMMATDGVHEEAVTLFPDRLSLVNAKRSVDFDAAGDFHTFRLEIKGEDVRLYADGKLVIDAPGEFKQPAIGERNQCSFGAAASDAQGEAVWKWVRYRSDKPTQSEAELNVPRIEGLRVERGETVEIIPGAIYKNLFQYRDGRLVVADRISTDGGKTWQRSSTGTAA